MDSQTIRYILSRAVGILLLLVAGLYGMGLWKQKQRKDAIISELKLICSDSSYFRQFRTEDARKTLLLGVALMHEAKQVGMDPDETLDASFGVKRKGWDAPVHEEEPPIRQRMIRNSLRANYENFLKLGYTPDFHTLAALKKGQLPQLRSGQKPEVGTIVDPELSPGLDRVVANLEIRPPRKPGEPAADIEVAIARQLILDLADANVIAREAAQRMIADLLPKPETD